MNAEVTFAINMINGDISRLSAQIADNREKLQRLKTAHTSITNERKHLMLQKHFLEEPELTSESWAGKHAEKFESARKEITEAFKGIAQNRVDLMLDEIEKKISSLQSDINSASHSISAKRAEIQRLSNM